MAMTAQVKAELASTQVTKACCRKSEVSSMLRFAGGWRSHERSMLDYAGTCDFGNSGLHLSVSSASSAKLSNT